MPSSDRLLGTVHDADGDVVEVWRNGDETVSLISLRADEPALTFTPGGLGDVRGLLDRAAMPGARVNHGPRCGCTPCLAEPSYQARRDE
jgi:hypothetical protein